VDRGPSSEEWRSSSAVEAIAAGLVVVLDEEFIADSRTRNPVMRMSATLSTLPKSLRGKGYVIPCE